VCYSGFGNSGRADILFKQITSIGRCQELPAMTLAVEYLVIIAKPDSFCDSVASLNRLLQVDSSLKLKGGKLTFEDTISSEYEIVGGEIAEKGQRYFHLKFTLVPDNANVERDVVRFADLLKRVRTVVHKVEGQVEVLWDDVSSHYARMAYAVLNDVENLMRKLIANFMLVTVGKEWIAETSPSEVQEAISKSKRKDYTNVLHTVDFIHLADFLVKPYSKRSIQELHAKLKTAATVDDLNALKEYIPISNWQRYFSKLVDCEDEYLNSRWSELYSLRCMVAHNSIVTKTDYDRIMELVGDLRPKLEAAISKLPQVTVPEDEREIVAENAVSSMGRLYGIFVHEWRKLEGWVLQKTAELGRPRPNITEGLRLLRDLEVMDRGTYMRLAMLQEIRNGIVHSTGFELPEDDLRLRILDLQVLLRKLENS
jgi:hypothetical protein